MSMPMTREEASQYRERWQMLARREREELRAMSLEEEFRRTAALSASAKAMGWTDEGQSADEKFVRERWRRLREVLGNRG